MICCSHNKLKRSTALCINKALSCHRRSTHVASKLQPRRFFAKSRSTTHGKPLISAAERLRQPPQSDATLLADLATLNGLWGREGSLVLVAAVLL